MLVPQPGPAQPGPTEHSEYCGFVCLLCSQVVDVTEADLPLLLKSAGQVSTVQYHAGCRWLALRLSHPFVQQLLTWLLRFDESRTVFAVKSTPVMPQACSDCAAHEVGEKHTPMCGKARGQYASSYTAAWQIGSAKVACAPVPMLCRNLGVGLQVGACILRLVSDTHVRATAVPERLRQACPYFE